MLVFLLSIFCRAAKVVSGKVAMSTEKNLGLWSTHFNYFNFLASYLLLLSCVR